MNDDVLLYESHAAITTYTHQLLVGCRQPDEHYYGFSGVANVGQLVPNTLEGKRVAEVSCNDQLTTFIYWDRTMPHSSITITRSDTGISATLFPYVNVYGGTPSLFTQADVGKTINLIIQTTQ